MELCTVIVQTVNGERKIQAVNCGRFAVHEYTSDPLGGKYVITHKRTGRQVCEPKSQKSVLVAAAQKLDMDGAMWNFDVLPGSSLDCMRLEQSVIAAGLDPARQE